MKKGVFAVLTALSFIFFFFVIPYLPNPALFGWMPLQLFCYMADGAFCSALWGWYFTTTLGD